MKGAKSPIDNWEASNYHLITTKIHYITEKMLTMKVVVSAFGLTTEKPVFF